MNILSSGALYRHVTRVLGIALSVTGVLFHRRGLMDWREPVFILVCLGLQEAFLVLPALRRFRPYLLALYLMLPAMFVLSTLDRIEPYRGDAISLALNTPLPVLMLPVQLMVLYTREAARLSSLVLVLTLFFVVAGLRRPLDDVIWPWLLGLGTLAALYVALSYPARVQLQLFPQEGRVQGIAASQPGSLMRGSFFAMLWGAVVSMLAATFVLFFAMPRIEFSSEEGLKEGTQPVTQGGESTKSGSGKKSGGSGGDKSLSGISSLSRGVELGEFGEIQQSMEKVLEVRPLTVQTPRYIATPLYLRAFTHAAFDGERWSSSPSSTSGTLLGEPQRGKRRLPGARSLSEGFRLAGYKVNVLRGGLGELGELPLTAEPVALTDFDAEAIWTPEAGILRAPGVKLSSSYGFESVEFIMDYGDLESRLAGKAPPRAPPENGTPVQGMPERAYWLLPKSLADKLNSLPVVAEVRHRAARRVSDGNPAFSSVAAARWLVRYFAEAKVQRTGENLFSYSLQRRPRPGADCIYRFLTTETYGHCEYFASAMCAVLRASGVPCRLAIGFHATTYNEERGVFEVYGSNAHAWVEVFVQGYGWITFDPTPPDNSAGDPEPSPEPEPTVDPGPQPAPAAPATDSQTPTGGQTRDPLIEYGNEAREQMARNIEEGFDRGVEQLREALAAATDWMPDFLPESPWARTAMVLVPLSVLVVGVFWHQRGRRKLKKRVLNEMGADSGLRGMNRRQQGLYVRLLLALARAGFHKRPFETPREFAWRVVRRGGRTFEAVHELTEQFYRLRYGPPSDHAEAEDGFKRLLGAFESQLRRAPISGRAAGPAGEQSVA